MKSTRAGRDGTVRRITRRAFIGTLVGLGGIWAVGSTGSAITRWGESQTTHTTTATFPAWVRATPASLAAYQAAYANLDLMATLPCFCGCDRMTLRHVSLKDCYIQPDGRIERHASVCGTCQGEAIDAARLADRGVPWPEIHALIVAEYGPSPSRAG